MNRQRIIEIVNEQNRWRREECLNLIASESLMSPLAESVYGSDFEGRYNEHIGPDRHYASDSRPRCTSARYFAHPCAVAFACSSVVRPVAQSQIRSVAGQYRTVYPTESLPEIV